MVFAVIIVRVAGFCIRLQWKQQQWKQQWYATTNGSCEIQQSYSAAENNFRTKNAGNDRPVLCIQIYA